MLKLCARCDNPGTFKCSRCKDESLRYCSKTCQSTDWVDHKLDCCVVSLTKAVIVAQNWIEHMMSATLAPCTIHKTVVHNGTKYYYMELPDSAPPDWRSQLETSLGENEYKQFRYGNSCELVTICFGAALQRYAVAKRLVVNMKGTRHRIVNVSLVGLEIKDEFLRPFVQCYCDVDTAVDDICDEDKDSFAGSRHKIICYTLEDGRQYSLDLARQEYAFPDSALHASFKTYLKRFVSRVIDETDPLHKLEQTLKSQEELAEYQRNIDHLTETFQGCEIVTNMGKQDSDFGRTVDLISRGADSLQGALDRLVASSAVGQQLTMSEIMNDCIEHKWL